MELPIRQRTSAGSFHDIGYALALGAVALLSAACGAGGDGDTGPNSPVATPFALVVNQDDTTLTTVRLDRKFSPVVSTLPLYRNSSKPDAIGGVAFSLGEWIFVTNTEENSVAVIDPVGGPTPILEDFLTTNPVNPAVKIGRRPTKIYRDPLDKEVLWTINEGDPAVTGITTFPRCLDGNTVSVLHNSHLGVGAGEKPSVTSIACLHGEGEHFLAVLGKPYSVSDRFAVVVSKTTGSMSILTQAENSWTYSYNRSLCQELKENNKCNPNTPNHSQPTGIFWSPYKERFYIYLSGYGNVLETNFYDIYKVIQKSAPSESAPPANTVWSFVGMTPDGKFLFFAGEDTQSDLTKVIGTIGLIDLTVPNPTLTTFTVPELENIRPGQFKFTPDGKRLYLLQSNSTGGLQPAQAANLKTDKLLVFNSSAFPHAPTFIKEIDVPSVGPEGMHAMDIWADGPPGAGSAKVVVVTNAKPGVNGSVSLIDAASHTITANIPVGRNPKQVTVYYFGLAASDNQATPIW